MRLYRHNGELRLDLQGEAIRLRQGDCGLALRVKLDAAQADTSWRARISNEHCINDMVELTPKDDGVTMLIPLEEQYLFEAGTLYVSVAAVKNDCEQWSNSVGITVIGRTNCCAGDRPVRKPDDPHGKLRFEGGATGEYDGSQDVVIYIPDAERMVWNATCDTDGLTQRKTVRTDKNFTLKSGRVVLVTFKYANANNNATLNVNSTGAKPVRRLDGTTDAARLWSQGQAVPFVYDGESWIVISGGKASTDLYGITRLSSATDSTSEELAATPKAVSAALTEAKEYTDKKAGSGGTSIAPLLVTVVDGQADYGISDIKATYDAGGNVQLFDMEGTYYAYLNHVDSNRAVFVEVDTEAVRVYTVDSSGAVSVVSKTLESGGSDVSLTVEGSKYTLTIGEEKTSWTIPTALKNPNALTFAGAVTGTYDGSKAMTVNIPSGGSGGTSIAPLLVTVIDGQADYGVSDIKAAYDAGSNVQLFDMEGTYYAYLNHVDSTKAVFVEVDTEAVRVYTVNSDGAVSVTSKTLESEKETSAQIWYGECATGQATAEKTVTVDSEFVLKTGTTVCVKFAYQNNVASPTLNVNSTGAKPVVNCVGTTPEKAEWGENQTVPLVYDGASWKMLTPQKATSALLGMATLSDDYAHTTTHAATTKAVADALAEAKTYADVTVINSDGSITAEDIYDLADGEYWFAQKFEQTTYSVGMNIVGTSNTLLVGYVLCKNHVMYCQATGYSVKFVAGSTASSDHAESGVAITGWPRTSISMSSATDSASETTAATSKAVSDALATAKEYADELIGGVENGTY